MAEQSNITNNPNQAILGLNTDNILQQVKPGTLTYSLNAQIDSFDGQMVTYQNEQSNVLCSEFKTGYRVIGHHAIIEQNRTIIFSTNPHTGESEIGEINNVITCDVDDPTHLDEQKSSNYVNNGYNNTDPRCYCKEETPEAPSFYDLFKKLNPPESNLQVNNCCTYRTILNAKCLNFNVNYPIHKVVHRNVDLNDDANKCGTEIYWTDGLNPRRFINLDDLPFQESIVDCQRVKLDTIDCDLMEVQPTVKLPCITPLVVSDGGSLIAGVYQFAIQYTNDKGEGYTAYYSITNAVSIYRARYGQDFNFQTDKSIKLLISGLDTKFKYFNLAVIKTINGAIDPELVGTFEILKDTTEIVYSGNNQTQINLTINDIFQKYPYYRIANEVNVAGDTLMYANLKSDKRINYQSIASAIQLKWMTYQIPYTQGQGYFNGVNSALYRGYMRDEIYAFEIVFLLKNGQQTDGFHIPGRESIPDDTLAVSNADVITTEMDSCIIEPTTQPRWKVYNTGSVIGFDPAYEAAIDPDCYIGPYEYGEFAYWESEKTYPCDTKIWGSLAGKPIRHHKFPDSLITHIHDTNPSSTNKEFDHKIYPIGVRIDLENIKQAILNSDLTPEQRSQIIGYRIIRSDRVNNKSVVAKGLLYNMGVYIPYIEGSPAPNQEAFYPNYPFNDLGDDPFLTNLSSANDGGFNIFLLDTLQNYVSTATQYMESMEAQLPTITPQCYTANNTCAADPFNPPVIEVTNSQLAGLQNLIFIAKQSGQALTNAITNINNYYDNKIQNNEQICQDDVPNLTLSASLVNDFLDDIDDINTSAAITNFNNIVDYINANASALNSHPQATNIFSLRTNLVNILNNNNTLQDTVSSIQDSFDDYNDALAELATVACDGEIINESAFSRSRLTFHSPDTHFFQPYLGTYLKFETVEGGTSIGNFVQVKGHAGHKLMSAFSSGIALAAGIAIGALFAAEPKGHVIGSVPGPIYTAYYPDFPSLGTIAEKALYWNQQFKQLIDNLLPYKNYAYQYNAIGIYNTFSAVPNTGNKQRPVDKAYYLIPGYQTLGDIFPINNWKRESSVFFRTNQSVTAPLLPNDPAVKGSLPDDDSRVGYSGERQIYSNVLSYYASNKRKLNDQYGDIYSYGTVDTGYCGKIDLNQDYADQTDTIFGGDIFINRFGLKRKLSYYIDTAVGRADGSDIEYSDLSNVGKTRYWYNTSSQQTPGGGFNGLMKSILGVPQSNLDGNSNNLFYQSGRIYLYSYGIAYFFVESEVNVDHRQAGNPKAQDFYPNVGTGIPNDWLQEVEVPIVEDNYYIYNKTYSKQNKENYFSHLPINFDPEEECQQDYTHRAIYSDPNRWRIYKPLSYFDFPKNYGKLVSIDTINNNQVLVRLENKSYVYNALTTIQTTSGIPAYLGNSDMFKSAPPIDFGETDLGYAGSQHHLLVRTEAGHLFVDAKRGGVFLINGSGVTPISSSGMSKWFAKNLEFEISKYFPNINTDNHFNGIGITGTWDNQYERFLLTKLDYKPICDNLCYDGLNFRDTSNREQIIKKYQDQGFTLTKEYNCQLEFERILFEPALPPNTDIYAFFDTTSMQFADGVAASNALKNWFNALKAANPQYVGNLYILPTTQERYVPYLEFIKRGSGTQIAANPDNPGNWFGTVAIMPPNFDRFSDNPNPNWTAPNEVILLAFVDEVETITGFGYHNATENSFAGQPTSAYQTDYMLFKSLYPDFEYFKAVLYPIVRPTSGATKNLILQGLACIEGTTLTQDQINATGTTVNVSSILTTNPYQGFILPDNSVITGLKNFGWRGVYNKISPASAVFNSATFGSELNDLLDLTGQAAKEIKDTRKYQFPIVELGDPKCFCNKSWTLSYSPGTKSWISFHSYLPNFYIGLNGMFLTGKNGLSSNQKSSVWIHNLVHTSFQRFYGKLFPYILEYPFAFKAQDEILQNVKDYTSIIEYYNHNDFYEINDNIFFNKAILYNNQQCSGILNLIPKPKNDLSSYRKYPKFNVDSKDIIFTKSDNFFNYNDFWDVVKNPNNHYPIWIESCESKSVDKELNNNKFDYSRRSYQKTKLRAKDLKIRHINDKYDRYKFVSKFMMAATQTSFK